MQERKNAEYMIFRQSDERLGNIAVKDDRGNQRTYQELEKKRQQYLTLIEPRSLIVILCDYDIETVEFYYCMMQNRVVPIMVDKNLDKVLLQKLIQKYEPEYVWEKENDRREETNSGDVILKAGRHILIRTNYKKTDLYSELALLLTTSGSTGSSKLVRISYRNIMDNSDAMVKYFNLRQEDRGIVTLPMHYCYGLSILHLHWRIGARILITDKSLLNIEFWNFLQKEGATNFAGVPYSYDILKQIRFLERDYPTLRFIGEGGGKLSEADQLFWGKGLQKKGIDFYIQYGQTEGTTYISSIPCKEITNKIGSIGVPIEGMTAYIDNQDDIGELVFQGSSVSLGYAQEKKDLALADINKGVLHTGDVACMDEDGFIFLKGRLKRFVKIMGARVSLDEVENILREEYFSGDVACLGADDIIVIFTNHEVNESELQQFCWNKFRIHKQMIRIERIEEFPRNSAGKVMYEDLKKYICKF